MEITHLFVKVEADAPLSPRQQITLVAPQGIVGDRNGRLGSPRQVLLLDQTTLDRFALAPGCLRENILCDALPPGLASGRSLVIGSAHIRLTFLCEPCHYLNEIQPNLAQRLKNQRGWLGIVTHSGSIQVGDRGEFGPECYPPLAHTARERFYEFVARIPPGVIVTTADLVVALGVSTAYYRAFPALLKAAQGQCPVHRIVSKNGELFSRHLPDQARLLQTEGISVTGEHVDLRDRWPPEYFHPNQPLSTPAQR